MAARYIHKHFAVLVRAICDVERTHTHRNKFGSNFLSLANEPMIKCDLALLADFDKIYFNHHMEFSHTPDKNIGRSGFLAPHHPVRYFLKVSKLQELEEEVEKGTLYINQTPKSAKLPSFWQVMRECEGLVEIEAQIDRARKFLEVYKGSLHKHNKHFCNELLFLGCFGEQSTATIVAKYLTISSLGNDPSVEDLMEGQKRKSIKSTMHNDKTIDLEAFADFLIKSAKPDCVNTIHFCRLRNSIDKISCHADFWNLTIELGHEDRFFFI
ncbi:unnamed protein product [Cylindrotheca closterium]|uniref:Uncharacterized protein n=1 Tax=Cylindrotheca closterium TaxID=2856 RepID=A0AAD2GAU8_9STRA|nr:unnamed protein product [Cylindrotheca closterium]